MADHLLILTTSLIKQAAGTRKPSARVMPVSDSEDEDEEEGEDEGEDEDEDEDGRQDGCAVSRLATRAAHYFVRTSQRAEVTVQLPLV